MSALTFGVVIAAQGLLLLLAGVALLITLAWAPHTLDTRDIVGLVACFGGGAGLVQWGYSEARRAYG